MQRYNYFQGTEILGIWMPKVATVIISRVVCEQEIYL